MLRLKTLPGLRTHADNAITRDMALAHLHGMAAAVDVPNAFWWGFADAASSKELNLLFK